MILVADMPNSGLVEVAVSVSRTHVWPPSPDRYTPDPAKFSVIPWTLSPFGPAFASPVAKYTTSGLLGETAMAPPKIRTLGSTVLSNSGTQVSPPSLVFQAPPPAVAT